MALLPALIAQLDSLQTASRIFVGFSGGADSHSLLHALVELSRREALPPIIALHINHGLHEDAMTGLRIAQLWLLISALNFMSGLYLYMREPPLRRKRGMPDTAYLNLS